MLMNTTITASLCMLLSDMMGHTNYACKRPCDIDVQKG